VTAAQLSRMSDPFFVRLLSKELPLTGFCPSAKFGQLADFFLDLAKQMRNKTGDKVKHEFITVCMLNALFGNPNLHLVQLHKDYCGPNTIERDAISFGNWQATNENDIEVQKKRRNAVCEVLRFHCQQVYRVD